MIRNVDKALALALEIEGLLLLIQNRQEMVPAQVYAMISDKAAELKSLTESTAPAPEPVAEPETKQPEPEMPVDEPEPVPAAQPVTVESEPAPQPAPVAEPVEDPVPDAAALMKHFTLNDKFRFRRELFANSQAKFEETLAMILTIPERDEIEEFLYNDLCLDPESPDVRDFVAVVDSILEQNKRH